MANNFIKELSFYIIVSLGFFFILYFSKAKDKVDMAIADFKNPVFLIFLLLVLVLSYYGANHPDPDVRKATHHSITAVIASYFSHLSLVFPAYFLVGITTYFSLKQYK